MNHQDDPKQTLDEMSPRKDPQLAADQFATTDNFRSLVSAAELHPDTDSSAEGLPTVPGYRVLREIARGAMGRVLAAIDTGLDRDVAIKVLLSGATTNRFVREAKITARLPHPGIPPVHALGTTTDGSPFLAMKLIAGQTMAAEIATADRPRLLQAFTQICQAVGFAHSRGVIHRDLKPANVMVGAFGEVQVMDWGLAKDLASQECEDDRRAPKPQPVPFDGAGQELTTDDLGGESTDDRTQAGQVMGTPAYMAPEQARGDATDARADVFALGGILSVILTGQPPFRGASALEVIRRAAVGDLAEAQGRLDACGADAELIALCRRCLSPSPADRPADGQAVAGAMTAYLNGVQERLRASELAEAAATAKAAAETRRRRQALVLAGAVLLVLVAGISGTTWGLFEARRQEQNARDETVEKDRALVAEAQRARAEELAKQRATKNAEIATSQRKLALEALYNTITKVDQQLLDRPDMLKLREDLVNDAIAGLKKIESSDDTNALADRTLGVAYQRIADILEKRGSTREARSQHLAALNIFERLLQENAQDHAARWNAAISHDKIGDACRTLDADVVAVRQHYLKALEHRELLPPDFQLGGATARTSVLNSYVKLGNLSLNSGDLQTAQEYFGKIHTVCERAMAENPKSSQAKQALASSYSQLATIRTRMGDVKAAAAYLQDSLQLRQELADADPISIVNQSRLAQVHTSIGDMKFQFGKNPEEALASYRRSRAILEKLHAQNAKNAEVQFSLSVVVYNEATALLARGKPKEALELYSRCEKLRQPLVDRDPKNIGMVLSLSLVQARLARHALAFESVESVAPRAQGDSRTEFNMACVYSICAAAVRNDQQGEQLSREDRALYELYVKKGLDSLNLAVKHGYIFIILLETDPDLVELRRDDGFAKILTELREKSSMISTGMR